MMNAYVVLLIALLFSCYVSAQWSYKNQAEWPPSCHGQLQSPIDLDKRNIIQEQFGHLQFDANYHHGHIVNITNTGHTVDIKIVNKYFLPGLTGGGLETDYALLSIHFHWHSEHTVSEEPYVFPLESHFVHFAKKYKTFEEALNYQDGVAVLAVFYDVTRQPNPAFDSIIKGVHAVAHRVNGSIHLHHPINFLSFLPTNTRNFYRYQGSLTTPNCTEVVTWTIFSTPSYISPSQLRSLTHIWERKNSLLISNYRDTQDLNDRDVFFNV